MTNTFNNASSRFVETAGAVNSDAFTYLLVACIVLSFLVVFLLYHTIKNGGKGKKDKKPTSNKIISSGKLTGSQKPAQKIAEIVYEETK